MGYLSNSDYRNVVRCSYSYSHSGGGPKENDYVPQFHGSFIGTRRIRS